MFSKMQNRNAQLSSLSTYIVTRTELFANLGELLMEEIQIEQYLASDFLFKLVFKYWLDNLTLTNCNFKWCSVFNLGINLGQLE